MDWKKNLVDCLMTSDFVCGLLARECVSVNKRWLVFMLSFLLALMAPGAVMPYAAEENPSSGSMNVILVMDHSGSMKYTDPERLSDEAALLFLDMMKEEGCRIGILSFSDEIEILRPLQELDIEGERDSIREILASREREGDTDLGAAAKAALEMADENTAVVFFTDGQIDLPQEEQVQRSMEDAQNAVEQAKERGIPFFCVGLDDSANESKYHLDQDFLRSVSEDTGGSFRYVTTAGDLPDLFHRIFADFVETKSMRIGDLLCSAGNDASLQFTIPNSSVLEANLILFPTGDTGDVIAAEGKDTLQQENSPAFQLTDPDGNELPLPSSKARISISRSYALIKLILPAQGTWTISVSTNEDFAVHVNLLFHYEAELLAQVQEDENGDALVTAYLTGKGVRLEDPDLYRQLICSVDVRREDTPAAWEPGEKKQYQLAYDEASGCWSGHIDMYPGSSALLDVSASGDELSRKADALRFTSGGSDDIIVDRLPDAISLEGMFPDDTQIIIPADSYFHSWDETATETRLSEADAGLLQISDLEGETAGSYMLTGKKSGETALLFHAQDLYGNVREEQVPVHIKIYWETLRWVIAAACVLLLIVVMAALLVLHKRKEKSAPAESKSGRTRISNIRKKNRSGENLSGSIFLMDCSFREEKDAMLDLEAVPDGGDLGTAAEYMLRDEAQEPKMELFANFSNAEQTKILEVLRLITVHKCHKNRRGNDIMLQYKGKDAVLRDCYTRVSNRVYLQSADVFGIRISEHINLLGTYYRQTDEEIY